MSRHPGKLVARRTEVRGFISSPALARPTHSPVPARRTGLVAAKHRTQHLLGQLALSEFSRFCRSSCRSSRHTHANSTQKLRLTSSFFCFRSCFSFAGAYSLPCAWLLFCARPPGWPLPEWHCQRQKQTCPRPAPVRRRSLQPSWRPAVSSSFCSRRA